MLLVNNYINFGLFHTESYSRTSEDLESSAQVVDHMIPLWFFLKLKSIRKTLDSKV